MLSALRHTAARYSVKTKKKKQKMENETKISRFIQSSWIDSLGDDEKPIIFIRGGHQTEIWLIANS